MTKHLHFDCFSGIAGDMTLGALIDLGAPQDVIDAELRKLALSAWWWRVTPRDAGHGMVGRSVAIGEGAAPPAGPRIVAVEGHGHPHAHPHPHPDHGHPHPTHAEGTGGNQTERSHAHIVELITQAHLLPGAQDRALRVFDRLAEAESKVHGVPKASIHFHEVGALDSIVDIVGVAIALDLLDVSTISCAPIPLGRGFTKSQHGRIPLPAPATLECLAGVPVYDSGLDVELVTPTGAAIVGALATEFCRIPAMSVERVGYGAGTRRHADRPNVLRLVLGQRSTPAVSHEVWEVAANIDDQTPEELAYVAQLLLERGALDVWTTPIVMKKGRAAHLLTVLCESVRRDELAQVVLAETTTLGVRFSRHNRLILARELIQVDTPYGTIRVKVGRSADGTLRNVAPEADDCMRAARAADVPLKQVRQAAYAAALGQLGERKPG